MRTLAVLFIFAAGALAQDRDFLTAAVAAFEVAPRIGMCVGQDFAAQGWHSGSKVVFSAAVAAAAGSKMAQQPVISVRDLTRSYQLGEVTVRALRGVSFDLRPGEVHVLFGENGAGSKEARVAQGCCLGRTLDQQATTDDVERAQQGDEDNVFDHFFQQPMAPL